jgi:hypothetical protein
MIRRAIGSLLVCLVATIARAEGPPDVVELHDGTFLQGRLTEWKPGSRAVIVLLNGESRVVHFSEIERTSGPSFEKIRDAGGRTEQDVDLQLDTTVVIPPPAVVIPPEASEPPAEPNIELPHVEPAPSLPLPPSAIPPPSFVLPPKASFLMDPRAKKGFMLVMMSLGPLIAGAVYAGVGSSQNERGMEALHDSFVGLGSVLIIGATASLVGGIVLLSTHKRDDAPNAAHASLRLSPGGLSVAGNF